MSKLSFLIQLTLTDRAPIRTLIDRVGGRFILECSLVSKDTPKIFLSYTQET